MNPIVFGGIGMIGGSILAQLYFNGSGFGAVLGCLVVAVGFAIETARVISR